MAQYQNSTTYFIHKDHLGSTRLMTTLGQNIYDSMDYLPFGEQVAGSTGTTHKFASMESDTESNLNHTLFRQYNPTQGRWMTPDPGGMAAVDPTNPQSWNRYAYVMNNPINLIDLVGLECYAYNIFGDIYCKKNDTGGGGPTGVDVIVITIGGSAPTQGGNSSNGGGGGGTGTPTNNQACVTPTAVQKIGIAIQKTAAKLTGKTLLAGLGVSAGGGFGKGVGAVANLSVQIAVGPNGNAAYVITYATPAAVTGTGSYILFTPSTKGFAVLGGPTFGFSNATDPSQLTGTSIQASTAAAGGLGVGGDVSFSGSTYQGDVTVGFGDGGRGSAGVITNTVVVPFCHE